MITRETATRIARAHAEIEVAEDLLRELAEREQKLPDDPDRGFGVQIGVRVDTTVRFYDVAPGIARQALAEHVRAKRGDLVHLCALAVEEARS